MDVARTSMIHAAAPHFLWPFAVKYAAHQLNLQPRVSLPETSPTLLWTGKVGDASAFRVWGSRAFVRDLSADKLSPRAVPCPGGTVPGGAEPGGAGSARVASRGASLRREVLSPQELREWFARRWGRAVGAGGTTTAAGSGGTCPGGAGAAGPGGTAEAAGIGPTGGSAGASGGTGAAGSAGPGAAGAPGVGAAGGVGAGGSADACPSEGAGAGAAGAGGATRAGAPAGSDGTTRPRPYFVPLLEQVLGLQPSPGPPFECPELVWSQSLSQPISPLPAPSPYTGPTGGLAERRAPASCPASPARPARTSRPRPPAAPGTHQMALLLLSRVVTDPSLASTAASALVADLVDFAARCLLDYTASLVAESASVCPPSVGVVLTGHADASWADDQATQRSSQGYTFSLGSGSVSWRSTRSSSVLSSSCEAEIYAGAMAAQELRWLTYLLIDLGEQPRSPPVLYVDNKAMLALCREHRMEHRTKHIALRYFLARELQQRGQLRLANVASEANTADIFTKALAPGDHQRFCTLLGFPTCASPFTSSFPSAGVVTGGAPSSTSIGPGGSCIAPSVGVARTPAIVAPPPPFIGGALPFCAPCAARERSAPHVLHANGLRLGNALLAERLCFAERQLLFLTIVRFFVGSRQGGVDFHALFIRVGACDSTRVEGSVTGAMQDPSEMLRRWSRKRIFRSAEDVARCEVELQG
ncbi:unnamed protein product [Closterium sp. NIES-54]